MVLITELRHRANELGIRGASKLKKRDLINVIAEFRAPEYIKRLRRAEKVGRFPALRNYNPLKKAQHVREAAQLNAEIDASLKAEKYAVRVKSNPKSRLPYIRKIVARSEKPHLYGLTKSSKGSLARAIIKEGPELLRTVFDLDTLVPTGVWVDALQEAKDEFLVDEAAAVFSTWKVDATMTIVRASKLLRRIPPGDHIIRIKYIREFGIDNWIVEDKFEPVRTDRRKIVTINRTTKSGAFVGIDKVYFQNAYPVTAVIYGLYPIRNPNLDNLDPLRTGDFNCVAKRISEHFENSSTNLTELRRTKMGNQSS